MQGAEGETFLAGERVLTGTILRFKRSQRGIIFVKVRIEEATGYQSNAVPNRMWVKRTKLERGIAWQKSVVRQGEERRRKKRRSGRFHRNGGIKNLHGTPRRFSPKEIAAWAEQHGYDIARSVEARLSIP